MKRFLSVACGLMLVAGVYACESSDSEADVIGGDVVLPDNAGYDPGVQTDNGRDPGVATDPGTDNPVQTDEGQPTDQGTDPGTDLGTDPGTDPGVPACVDDPIGSCKAVYECMGECPDGTAGQACVQQCQNNLSAAGMADYQAFNQCLQTKCAGATTNEEFYACLEANCIEQYYGCFWGCTYLTCGDLINCITSCPDDNPATPTVDERSQCVGNCWGESTAEAQIGLQRAIDCTQNACPVCAIQNPTQQQADECDTCWGNATSTTCETYWDACTNYGTGGCAQLWNCYMPCDSNECAQACIAASSKNARALLQSVFDCIYDLCDSETLSEEEWLACANGSINAGGGCETQVDACMADGAVAGTDPCGTLWNCYMACQDQTCAQNCLNSATANARSLLQAVFTCINANCDENLPEQDWINCANAAINAGGACETQTNACMNDAAAS